MPTFAAPPCPFCGHGRVRVDRDYDGAFAVCLEISCRARGPVRRAIGGTAPQRSEVEVGLAREAWADRGRQGVGALT